MDEIEHSPDDYRAEIALGNRRRALEARNHKLTMLVFGLMAYLAFANVLTGVMQLPSGSPLDAGLGIVLGTLYVFGAYRVWLKDDTRWWPVAVPAAISLIVLLLVWFGGAPRPVPLLLNLILLVLVPIRARASSALAAVPNNSFKPKPLRGSA